MRENRPEKNKFNLIHITTIIIFLAGVVLVTPNKSEGVDAKALFESKCKLCHSIERPKSKKKSADAWKNTVMRMKNINGCPITDEEAGIIIKYLTDHYGD